MMKKTFLEPWVEIFPTEAADIVTLSVSDGTGDGLRLSFDDIIEH